MFQSVTYTGFEKHPERRAWVEGVVMPIVKSVLADDADTLSVHWHDPDLEQFYSWELQELVQKVLPDLGDKSLVGDILGDDSTGNVLGKIAGVLLILRSERLPVGWGYLPLPRDGDELRRSWIEWLVSRIHVKMLQASVRKALADFERLQSPEPAGV